MDRYFIRGLVDGSLSSLGVVIGASTAIGSIEAKWIIIAAGLGGGIANGFSNVLGAFMAEKAVIYKRFEEIEKAMMKSEALRESEIGNRKKKKIYSSGIIDGLATIIGALLPVIPFFLITASLALWISVGLTLGLLFSLGIIVGRISKENIILSGIKMATFGAVAAIIAALIKTMMP
ncbi:MAG: TIGR00267 family protein [Hadesarchaea archaeon]|nr:TIGR00267 family protein [Hadesarchaea archaeon]